MQPYNGVNTRCWKRRKDVPVHRSRTARLTEPSLTVRRQLLEWQYACLAGTCSPGTGTAYVECKLSILTSLQLKCTYYCDYLLLAILRICWQLAGGWQWTSAVSPKRMRRPLRSIERAQDMHVIGSITAGQAYLP